MSYGIVHSIQEGIFIGFNLAIIIIGFKMITGFRTIGGKPPSYNTVPAKIKNRPYCKRGLKPET